MSFVKIWEQTTSRKDCSKTWNTWEKPHEHDPDEGEDAGPDQGEADHPPGLGQVGEYLLAQRANVEEGGQPEHCLLYCALRDTIC